MASWSGLTKDNTLFSWVICFFELALVAILVLKKKKGKKLVQRNIFLQRRKIMWCLLVFQDLPALKNSGLASLSKGPISLCHRSSSRNTSKYLVSAMKLFLGAGRLHGSSETAMKLQLVQLLGSKSKKSIWVLLALICYCWYFIVVPLQMILYSCLMKIHFCYSLCVVNIENKMSNFMLSAWNLPLLFTLMIKIDGFVYWIILSIALQEFRQNLQHDPCGLPV